VVINVSEVHVDSFFKMEVVMVRMLLGYVGSFQNHLTLLEEERTQNLVQPNRISEQDILSRYKNLRCHNVENHNLNNHRN
jgi:hypothetical protein